MNTSTAPYNTLGTQDSMDTVRSFTELDKVIGSQPLSKELEEFIKVFPPPYRCDGTDFYASNGKELLFGDTDREHELAFAQLICTLLNKHLQHDTNNN